MDSDSVTIKKLTEYDEQTISDFKQLFFKWDLNRIEKKLIATTKGKNIRFVALKNEKIIGEIKVRFGLNQHSHRAYLSSLVVVRKERYKGVGTKIVAHTCKNLPKRIKLITLEVNENNAHAIDIYTKAGFNEYGSLDKASKVSNKYLKHLLLAKELK